MNPHFADVPTPASGKGGAGAPGSSAASTVDYGPAVGANRAHGMEFYALDEQGRQTSGTGGSSIGVVQSGGLYAVPVVDEQGGAAAE